jgi:hypothetical protein
MMWRRIVALIRRRSPSEHHAALSRRLRQAKKAEESAAGELRRLEGKHGETRATRRAKNRLRRLQKRTNRLAVLVAAARPVVMREH